MDTDYFTNNSTSSYADFHTTNTHKEINLRHDLVSSHHQTTPDFQLTVENSYTPIPLPPAAEPVAELTPAKARLVEEN